MTGAQTTMDQTHLRETLKAALDAWRFQIDSYWSRNSYFVTFHTAIMAAVWEITKNKDLGDSRRLAAECFCYAGMFLAVLWLVNNIRVHQYILYWWKKAEGIEKLLAGPEETRLVFGYDKHRLPKRIPGDYHIWMNSIPVLFLFVWIGIRILCF
jgi:hypothetical protein